ncbi:unnamed protein product [Peronospora belbahrii]|uniref:Uncharacterized protein n=1 Tax=Peronospora belbahrii TaxID=622444 RepID=A0AAU9KUI1_9STRA|nr:unnamed protein product [Peronospora belbahrii]
MKKFDPSRVWVGKKTMEKLYDPKFGNTDHELVEKMKQLIVMYDEENEYGGDGVCDRVEGSYGGVGAPDEYDGDYNDEFDDFVPFGVRDGGSAYDGGGFWGRKKKKGAKEKKGAFWDGMKNRNREIPLIFGDDYKDRDNKEEKDDLGEQKPCLPMPGRQQYLSGPKHKSARQKDSKQAGEKKHDEPLTPQQIQRQRARKDKNKSKIANHNRKDRAMKKMG